MQDNHLKIFYLSLGASSPLLICSFEVTSVSVRSKPGAGKVVDWPVRVISSAGLGVAVAYGAA